ncbi:MAG: DUF6587 family protein [Lysobacteraceae bacterium]
MTLYGFVQSLVLAALLTFCVIKLFAQLAPGLMRRFRGRLSLRLAGRGAAADRLSRWLRPEARIAAGCSQVGSTPGCNSCSLAGGSKSLPGQGADHGDAVAAKPTR